MASSSKHRPLSLEQLLEAVERLPPAERREFQLRLRIREQPNGSLSANEETLAATSPIRLPEAEERQLRKLIARSEQGKLTPKELAEYQSLAQKVQRIDAARANALRDLARRRKSAPAVKSAIEREGRADDA
jgi:hypothetical protein